MTKQGANNSQNPERVTMVVRATVIRDGTSGISLSIGGELVGEWADSRAKTLSLTDAHEVRVHGADDELLYLFSVPGKAISAEAMSDREVTVTFEM